MWLDVWDGLKKWIFRHEMFHVLQKSTVKLFFNIFVYNFLGLCNFIDLFKC